MELLMETTKIDLISHERLEKIKFDVECESAIGVSFETRVIFRGICSSSGGSSVMMSAPCIILILQCRNSLGVGLGFEVGLDSDRDLGIFQDGIYILLRSEAMFLVINIITYFEVSE